MIQECKNPIVEDDFHGFLHRNCEGTEQLQEFVIVRNRSERISRDCENMIQECKNSIVKDDVHGFLHRNCEGTVQLQKNEIYLEVVRWITKQCTV